MRTRRSFLAIVSTGVVAAPFFAWAQQQAKVWRIGVLASRKRPERFDADLAYGQFLRSLAEAGYVEARNLKIEWRFTEGDHARLPALAEELVKLEVDLILGTGTPAAFAAQKATTTIPIVFINAGDPLGTGLVRSLSRPGGNITGFSVLTEFTTLKLIEMMISFVPGLSRLAALGAGASPSSVKLLHSLAEPAKAAGLTFLPIEVRSEKDIASAFEQMAKERSQALICLADSFLVDQRKQIVGLAERHHLPSAGGFEVYAEAGGLMSYGINVPDNYRNAVTYIDKILKGTNPGELPVEQPRKLQLVINRKTAKALGLEIPPDLLVLADRVIE